MYLFQVNNATALMAYQGLMMRNPQYFAAAAGFSSPPTTCSSAASLHPGNVGGGPSFGVLIKTEFYLPKFILLALPLTLTMLHSVSSVADIF